MGEVLTMQDAILKKVGIKINGSYETKRFRIEQFCRYQGITEKELFKILTREKEPCWIPLRRYGVELEGGIPCSREEFAEILNENGIPAYSTGYNHDIVARWKIGTDSSVSVRELTPVEITSPQFIGMGEGIGFKEIERLLKIWNEKLNENGTPVGVNRTCGGHVHIDVYDFSLMDVFNLQMLVYCLWDLLKFLVPPSRRNNSYCRELQPHHFIKNFTQEKGYPLDRYLCVNFNGFSNELKFKNVEFRFWAGTTSVKKVRMHVMISLCLVEAAKKKTVWDLLENTEGEFITIEDLLDFIGVKGMHPVLKEVREFAVERFNHFVQSEEERFLSKEKVYKKIKEAFENAVIGNLTAWMYSALAEEYFRKSKRERAAKNRINHTYTHRIVSSMDIRWEGDRKIITIPRKGTDSKIELVVSDEITCSCRKFRREGECIHKSIVQDIDVVLGIFGITSSRRWELLRFEETSGLEVAEAS